MKKVYILVAAAFVSACETTGDPADGGFLAGVAGIAGGGYQDRVDAEQAGLERDQAESAALQLRYADLARQSANIAADITRLRAIHTQLRVDIANKVAELRAAGIVLDGPMAERVDLVVNSTPSGGNDEQRLAALQAAITNARLLSDDLAKLSA